MSLSALPEFLVYVQKNIKICPKICSNSVFCFLRKIFLVEDTEH